MNKTLHNTIGLASMLMLAAFALFSNAAFGADKTYTLDMNVLAPATSPATVTAKFTNAGNSSFNSLTIKAPTGFEIIGTPTSNRGTASIIAPGSGNQVKVLNINLPTGSGQSVTLTLSVRIVGAACGTTSGDWSGVPWSGSNLTGNTFGLVQPSHVNTSISIGCITFLQQPTNALVNAVITNTAYTPAGGAVQVNLNPAPTASTTVTLTSSCTTNALTLSGNTSTGTNAQPTFGTLASSTPGAGCTLTASAPGYNSAMSSPAFKVSAGSLAFGNQPNSVIGGALITNTPYNIPAGQFVSVNLLLDGVATTNTVFDGIIVTIGGTCYDTSSGTTANAASGVATFSALASLNTPTTLTNCALTATAPQFGMATSGPFTVTPADGNLFCDGQGPPGSSKFTDVTNTVSGKRGASNKDGSTCVPVQYDATGLATASDSVVNFKWDTASQPNAAFNYTITWNPTAADSVTGMPPPRHTKVAWEVDGSNNPKYVFGVACVSPALPAPYGTLSSGIGAGDLSLTLTAAPGATPPTPFPIVIGTERMMVQSVSGTTFTLVTGSRGAGGTTAAAHGTGAPVMSTPLPIDNNPYMAPPAPANTPNPYLGKQAQMCIQMEGFMSYSPGMVQFMTNIFDIGDGWVSYD